MARRKAAKRGDSSSSSSRGDEEEEEEDGVSEAVMLPNLLVGEDEREAVGRDLSSAADVEG